MILRMALGLVHGCIGLLDDVVQELAILRVGGYAYAGREAQVVAQDSAGLLYVRQQLVGQLYQVSLLLVFGDQDHKLIPALAADGI